MVLLECLEGMARMERKVSLERRVLEGRRGRLVNMGCLDFLGSEENKDCRELLA